MDAMGGKGRPSSNYRSAWSNTTIMICFISGIIVLYGIYSWMKMPQSHYTVQKFNTWKTGEFVDVPAEVHAKAKDIKIEERHMSFEFNDKSIELFYREVRGARSGAMHVLMLHGAGSSSKIWVQLGTMRLLGALGYRVVAVDLPGYGSSAANKDIKKESTANFLDEFIKREHLDRPVIVSPSMSGKYSIPYLMKPRPETCGNRARAYIPLAPTHTDMFTHSEYHRCEIPVLITYGTKDVEIGLVAVGNLRNMPNRELFPMEGAGHPNYEEKPDEWHKLLYNFMLAVKKHSD